MTKPAFVIMAAGTGNRYGGLKQIDPIGAHGENIIDYSIYDALRAGFEKVVFVINKDIEEEFRNNIGKRIENQCETIYVFQELKNLPDGFNIPQNRVKPWGTAHAIMSCKCAVDSPFAVVNADDYYGPISYQKLLSYLEKTDYYETIYKYCMVGYILENTLTNHGHVSRGVCQVDTDGYLLDIDERTHIEKSLNSVKYTEDDGQTWVEIPRKSIASMNIWGFQPSIFPELEKHFIRFLEEEKDYLEKAEYLLPSVVKELIKKNKARVKVLSTQEKWFGVTYQDDKKRVKQSINDLIQRGIYPQQLWRH